MLSNCRGGPWISPTVPVRNHAIVIILWNIAYKFQQHKLLVNDNHYNPCNIASYQTAKIERDEKMSHIVTVNSKCFMRHTGFKETHANLFSCVQYSKSKNGQEFEQRCEQCSFSEVRKSFNVSTKYMTDHQAFCCDHDIFRLIHYVACKNTHDLW